MKLSDLSRKKKRTSFRRSFNFSTFSLLQTWQSIAWIIIQQNEWTRRERGTSCQPISAEEAQQLNSSEYVVSTITLEIHDEVSRRDVSRVLVFRELQNTCVELCLEWVMRLKIIKIIASSSLWRKKLEEKSNRWWQKSFESAHFLAATRQRQVTKSWMSWYVSKIITF